VVVPPSIVLPNYDRIPIGQREGLEGNAYVARTEDADAAFYNPAGLGMVKSSGLNASANAYEWAAVQLEGLGKKSGRSNISSLATIFAAAIGAPVFSSDRWRLGLAITRPIIWAPGSINLLSPAPVTSGSELFGYSSKVDFSNLLPTLSVGFAPHGVRKSPFRVGAGIGVAFIGLTQGQTLSDRATNDTTIVTGLRTFYAEGSTKQLLLNAGVQWDVIPRVTLGAHVTSPGIRIGGTTVINYSGTIFTTNGSTDLAFLDNKAKFNYKLPIEAIGGAAVHFTDLSLELDVKYHGSVSSYDMYSSDSTGQLTTVEGTNPPVITRAPFTTTLNQAKSVVNVAVGGQYNLSQHFRLNGGFSTDKSPVPDENSTIFRRIDLNRITGGVTFQGEHLSGSIGLGYNFGSGTRTTLGSTAGGEPVSTKLTVTTINIMYALSYVF
jgi:long-subunit fatty acid transport protein